MVPLYYPCHLNAGLSFAFSFIRKGEYKVMSLKYLTISLAALLSLIAIACSTASTPTPTATPIPIPSPTPSLFPLVITDSNGNDITIEEPPQRIIAFDSAAVEILFAIGEGHRIVGTHSFVSYPPETEGIPRVGDAFNMNFEKVVEQEPDLVYIFLIDFSPIWRSWV